MHSGKRKRFAQSANRFFHAKASSKTLKVASIELAEKQRVFIKEKSALAPLDEPTAIEAAKMHNKMKQEIDGWGLADSIVYATGLIKEADVVTGGRALQKTQPSIVYRITTTENKPRLTVT